MADFGEAQRRRATVVMAWLFIVGSFCFALGSFPLYFQHVDVRVVAVTFFIGSIFFTTAGRYQVRLELDGAWFGQRWRSTGWQAAFIQSIGTLAFNVSTFFAIDATLSNQQVNRLVWAPDAVGSVAFLVASALGILAVRRATDPGPHDHASAWWNMVGSILFGVSAVGALILPTTGEMVNVRWVNGGTFLGAVCFLVGAAILLPRWNRGAEVQASASTTS